MSLKKCKDCGKEKSSDAFYGVQGECKECTKFRVRNYAKSDHGKKMIKAWWKTEKGRLKQERHRKRFRERYPEKYKAHTVAQHALRKGILIKKPCEICGDKKAEKHHDDYSKPLEVRWLCRKHHQLIPF